MTNTTELPADRQRIRPLAMAERLIVPSVIFVVAIGALVLARGFTAQARQVPMFVGIPLAVLSGAILLSEIRTAARVRNGADPPDHPRSVGAGMSQRGVLGFLAGLALSWLLLGFPLGAVVFLVPALRLVARAGWLATAVITALTVAPLHFLLAELLGMSSFGGLLFR